MQTTESCQNNCLNSNLPKKVRKKKAVMSVCNSLTSRYGAVCMRKRYARRSPRSPPCGMVPGGYANLRLWIFECRIQT